MKAEASMNIDFIIQNKIGQGSFGKVYKVKSKINNEIYAAKISQKELEESTAEMKIDISREVSILSKLNHPSVLKFIFFSPTNFKHKPKPVIITEYAPNGTLKNFIELSQSNIYNWDDTRKLITVYGIASAMSYLHSHDIIHRDLKPENILMDDFLFPKIADFGLSKINTIEKVDSIIKSADGCIKGTPSYMASEIWFRVEYSKASDVYTFGLILFEIYTQKKNRLTVVTFFRSH